jgi:hypothetical protein
MQYRQGHVLETLRRVQGFLDKNPDILATVNGSGSRKMLDERITQFTAHAVDQQAGILGSKGESGRHQSLRGELRRLYMKPIAAIARANLRAVPEFGALGLPHPEISTAKLVNAASAMAEAAGNHAEVFVAAGMPEDFVARLQAATKAVADALDAGAASRGRRVGATEGLKVEERRGRDTLRVLDTLVVPALGTREDLAAEWKSLRRVDGKPGGQRTDGQPTASAATATTATPAAPGEATPKPVLEAA